MRPKPAEKRNGRQSQWAEQTQNIKRNAALCTGLAPGQFGYRLAVAVWTMLEAAPTRMPGGLKLVDDEQSAVERITTLTSGVARIPLIVATIGAASLYAAAALPSDGSVSRVMLGSLAGLGILSIVGSLTMFSFLFLRRSDLLRSEQHVIERVRYNPTDSAGFRSLEDRLVALEALTETYSNVAAAQVDEITKAVLDKVSFSSADDVIIRAQALLKDELGQDKSRKQVRDAFYDTIVRLGNEASRLRRGGAYNLAIGGSISITGIAILSYFLFVEQAFAGNADTVHVLTHYIPRLSLVLLVEGFSLFFLKLYKSSVEDVRYFQNELTNIEQRLAAFELALAMDDQTGASDVVKVAMHTERNFVLKKGETTLAIERAKIEAGLGATELLKAAAPIIGKLGK